MSKKQPKLTPWFRPGIKPKREGVYIATISKREVFYRRWTAGGWTVGGWNIADAERATQISSIPHLIHWRGLAVKP